MKVAKHSSIEMAETLMIQIEGSSGMSIRPVSDNVVHITLHPGGHTPDHQHYDRERLIVLSGAGQARIVDERIGVGKGDYLEFEPDERHQIINIGENDLSFMCFRNQ